jgi:thiol-disulfide isomerase/thioredoxin
LLYGDAFNRVATVKQNLWIFWLGLGLMGSSFAETRKWTNTTGTVIEAEFVSADSGNVTLRLKNGKTSTFSESKLSEADREFIKTAKAVPPAAPPAAATKEVSTVPANRKAKWLSKMDRAQKEAAELGLPILLLFTGTEWCPYCIQLEEEILSKDEFKKFADQNLVLLKVELAPGSELTSKADEALAEKYGKGAPKYLVLDSAGTQLAAQRGYQKGTPVQKVIDWIKAASAAKAK